MAREWRDHTQRINEEMARLRGEVPADPPTQGKRINDEQFFQLAGIGEA